MARTEKAEERKYARWVKAQDGRCIKLNTVGPFGRVGEPDRMTLLPGKVHLFMEFKRPDEEPTEIQAHVHKHYRRMGFKVYVVYSAKEAIAIACKALAKRGLHVKAVSKRVRKVRAA